jgi:hypothetical protein
MLDFDCACPGNMLDCHPLPWAQPGVMSRHDISAPGAAAFASSTALAARAGGRLLPIAERQLRQASPSELRLPSTPRVCGGQVKGTSDRVRSGPSEAPQDEIVSTITDGWCRPIARRGFGDPRRRVAANLCGTLRHDQVNVGYINTLPVEKRKRFPLL